MRTAPVAAIVLAFASAPLVAQRSGAPFTVQETGEAFTTLQDAVDAIGEGSGTVLIAPGTYRECAVQDEGRVAYVAHAFGSVVFDGVACEEKAALVLGGREARVEGLIFQNIRVPDGNGAGIRIEQGDLLVRESLFRDSEQGILSASDPGGSIRVERSTFSGLGRCEGERACAHSIYVGNYGALSVVRSRFERGSSGHYVKSRAPRIEVLDSSFDDSEGRATNYMIDLSNGATGTIARNVFVQGRDKENYSTLIFVGPEGARNSSEGLTIVDNEASIVPGLSRRTTFVADRSGAGIRIENNRLGPQIARYERR